MKDLFGILSSHNTILHFIIYAGPFILCPTNLVKSAGTGVVTNDAIGFLCPNPYKVFLGPTILVNLFMSYKPFEISKSR